MSHLNWEGILAAVVALGITAAAIGTIWAALRSGVVDASGLAVLVNLLGAFNSDPTPSQPRIEPIDRAKHPLAFWLTLVAVGLIAVVALVFACIVIGAMLGFIGPAK
jgi:hypothetical protein